MKSQRMQIIRQWVSLTLLALTTAFCLAFLCLWVRSYFVADQLEYGSRQMRLAFQSTTNFRITSRKGEIEIALYTSYYDHPLMFQTMLMNSHEAEQSTSRWRYQSGKGGWSSIPPARGLLRSLGFSYFDETAMLSGVETRDMDLLMPCWLFTVTTGTISIVGFITARRKRAGRRQSQGQCLTCGYDLRATPERCPECGTVATQKAVTLK